LTINLTFKILHSYLSQCAIKQLTDSQPTASSFITKKAFQNHAQAALDTSAINQNADLCLVSAQSVEHQISNNLDKLISPTQLYWLLTLHTTVLE